MHPGRYLMVGRSLQSLTRSQDSVTAATSPALSLRLRLVLRPVLVEESLLPVQLQAVALTVPVALPVWHWFHATSSSNQKFGTSTCVFHDASASPKALSWNC